MKKKSVLILGALSDIAKSLAHRFGENGYELMLAARNKEELKIQADDLKQVKTVVLQHNWPTEQPKIGKSKTP